MYKKKIKEIITNKAQVIYGKNLPEEISARIDNELCTLDEKKSECFWLASLLSKVCSEDNISYQLKNFTNPPFIGFLLGLTNINPLSAHYSCKKCHYVEFTDNNCGVDLQDKECPICNSNMNKDGYDVPMFHNASERDAEIQFVFDAKEISKVYEELENIFSTYSIIKMYLKIDKKTNRVTTHMFKNTPSEEYEFEGIFLLPKETSIALRNGEEISHAEYRALYDSSVFIGISIDNKLDCSDKGQLNRIITKTKPSTFNDKIRIAGLFLGGNLWENNAEELIKNRTLSLDEIITCREDICNRLLAHGYSKKDAWYVSERIRKGKGLTNQETKVMQEKNVPNWFIMSCNKILYAPSRGMCVMFSITYKYIKILR